MLLTFWRNLHYFLEEEKGTVQKIYGSFCYISLKFRAKTKTKENFESSALHLELHISGMSFFAAEKGAKSLHSTSIEILSIFFSLFGTWTYFLPFSGFLCSFEFSLIFLQIIHIPTKLGSFYVLQLRLLYLQQNSLR